MPTQVTKSMRKKARRRGPKPSDDPVGQYASDAWSLAKRTAFGLNEIRKLINIETKYFDVIANSTSTQAGNLNCLSLLAQGLDQTDRVGDSIKLQRIAFRGVVYAGATVPVTCRIIVCRDLENQGALVAGSDLLASAGVNSGVSPYNWINIQKRFSILFDETVSMDVSNQTAVVGFDAMHGGHVRFRGTTVALASQAEGSLWCGVFTDAAATTPTVRWVSRITYTDD